MDLERIRKRILQIFSQFLDLEKLFLILIGSQAERVRPFSDLDLLFFYLGSLDDLTFLELKEALNQLEDLPVPVDLIEGNRASEDFLAFALDGGKIWHIGKDFVRSLKTLKEP